MGRLLNAEIDAWNLLLSYVKAQLWSLKKIERLRYLAYYITFITTRNLLRRQEKSEFLIPKRIILEKSNIRKK